MEREGFDLVLTDLKMPRKGGLDVLEKARSAAPDAEVVIVTGFVDVPTAVESIKKGGFDYLLKPICVDQVEMLLRRVKEHVRLVEENKYLHAELAGGSDIIGESRAIKDVCQKAVFVAATDATVLLQGESGTGKELVSRLIHNSSPRADGPFIRVNCAALSESILESELFGHERGAFTGAHAAKPGRFELADGGTLLLDEVTETSEKLQAELLRVIEEKEFERVGGTRTVRVDVRIITTTNRDLAKEVAEKRFREDLYYRLNVVPLVLPPLREREGDVDVLVEHFVGRFARRLGRSRPSLSDGALVLFRRYPWPGNVRELENLVQRLVIMDTDGSIDAEDLPDYLAQPAGRLGRLPAAWRHAGGRGASRDPAHAGELRGQPHACGGEVEYLNAHDPQQVEKVYGRGPHRGKAFRVRETFSAPTCPLPRVPRGNRALSASGAPPAARRPTGLAPRLRYGCTAFPIPLPWGRMRWVC